jgi:hypothetical protein
MAIDQLPTQPVGKEEKIKPCLVCLAPNDRSAESCEECGAPFGTPSVLSPYQVIGPEGPRWHRSLRRRRSVTGKATIWDMMFFGTLHLFLLTIAGCMVYFLALSRNGLMEYMGFWLGIGISYIAVKGLVSTTRDYLRSNKASGPKKEEHHL